MTLPDTLARWPVWYLALVAFVAFRGASTLFGVWRARTQWRTGILQAPTVPERARLQGRRLGVIAFGVFVLVGAALLLLGSDVARVALAATLLFGVRAKAANIATGIAEGRRSAELASSVEYVAGRVAPRSLDWILAVTFVAVTQGLPAALLIISMQLG